MRSIPVLAAGQIRVGTAHLSPTPDGYSADINFFESPEGRVFIERSQKRRQDIVTELKYNENWVPVYVRVALIEDIRSTPLPKAGILSRMKQVLRNAGFMKQPRRTYMIEKIRNEMTEVLEEREGAGRADLVLLLHPRGDVLKALIAELGEGKAPERAAGIEIQYTRDVDEDEFQIVWRDDVTEEADE